jgi:hypothetical protein
VRSPRFPLPCRAVIRDANEQTIAYVYSRDDPTEGLQAKMLTKNEARDRGQHCAAAGVGREGRLKAMAELRGSSHGGPSLA